MDKQKEVLKSCPFCGGEAEIVGGPDNWHPTFHDPDSGGYPIAITCKSCPCSTDAFDDYDEARMAWNQRWQEPNRVLTLEEVRDRGGCPVWCEDRDGSGVWALVDNGEDKCFDADYGDWEFYCYGWTNERGWRAWTGKPTDEERKAARWEDD